MKTEWMNSKYKTEIVLEEEPLTVYHSNEGLTWGRGDWAKRTTLLGSGRGGGLLKVWVATVVHGLTPSWHIVSSTSVEGSVCSVILTLNGQKW